MASFNDLFSTWSRLARPAMAPERLLEGLAREEPEAIRQLSQQTAPIAASVSRQFRLSAEEAQEIHCDCILIMIQKIRNGTYSLQDNGPLPYAATIIRNLAKNYRRRGDKHNHEPLDLVPEVMDLHAGYTQKEAVDRLEALLERIDAECKKLISLKHLEGWSDKEILEKRMTHYRSIPAIKNRRSQCMKTLTSLAEEEFRKTSE